MKSVLKRGFLSFAFLSLVLSCGAETKIAIIGDSDVSAAAADMVLAKLSNEEGLSFLERKQIDKILQEQNLGRANLGSEQALALGRLAHADILAVIGSADIADEKTRKNRTLPSSLIVLDAKNGFRLADKDIPNDVEAAAEKTAETIRTVAAEKDSGMERKLVSTLSVRNTGADKKFEPALVGIAAEVERRFAASKDVAVLERASLGIINQERKLSNEIHSLAPSAFLLDYEVRPGAQAGKAGLTVRVLDTSGAELKKFPFENCMTDAAGTSGRLFQQLAEYLSVAPAEKLVPSDREAVRFLNEHRFFSRIEDFAAAEKKLEACMALNPNSPSYRKEMAYFLIKKDEVLSKKKKGEERFAIMTQAGLRAAGILNETKELFPVHKGMLYDSWDSASDTMLNIFINKNKLTGEQKADAKRMADMCRENRLAELRQFYKFDLSDGIGSTSEMRNFYEYCYRSTSVNYYFDAEGQARDFFVTTKSLLSYGGEFLRKNPEMKDKIPYESQYFFIPNLTSYGFMDKELEEGIVNSEEIISLAERHPSPRAQAFGLNLNLARKTIINKHDSKKFREDLDDMIRALEKINAPPSPVALDFLYPCFLYGFICANKDNERAYLWKQVEWARKHQKRAGWYLTRNYMRTFFFDKDKNDLAAAVESLAPEIAYYHLNREPQNKDEIGKFLRHYASILKDAEGKRTGIYTKAIEILTEKKSSVETQKLAGLEDFGLPLEALAKARFVNAKDEDGKIVALVSSKGSYYVFQYDIKTGKSVLAAKAENVGMKPSEQNELEQKSVFSIGGNFFLVGGQDKILVIPRNGAAFSFIEGLPAERVSALAELDGRIYASMGRRRSDALETVMFSCLSDGSARTIHISTLRRGEENTLDRQAPFVISSMFADPAKKRLLFLCGRPAGGLWEFVPDTGKFRRLVEFKDSFHSYGASIGSIIYLACGNHDQYHTFDTSSDSDEFILFLSLPEYGKNLKPAPKHMEKMNVMPPFYEKDGHFWFGGWKTVTYAHRDNLCNYESIRDLDADMATFFFPHPDGKSVLAVTGRSIWKLTPPEETGKKNKP